MIGTYKAVFFDVGGTLLHPYPSVGEIYGNVARRYGCDASSERIETLFRSAWLERDGLATLVSHSSEKIERDWWHSLVKKVFDSLGGIEDFEAFFDELYDLFARSECWRLYPDAVQVLESLRARGVRLAAISNWDSRLSGLMKGLGIDHYFETILISAVFGASKPSPRIFRAALETLSVSAGEAVHIGDSVEDDIRGAMAAGIDSILIDRHPRPRRPLGEPFERIPFIRSLSELLG